MSAAMDALLLYDAAALAGRLEDEGRSEDAETVRGLIAEIRRLNGEDK